MVHQVPMEILDYYLPAFKSNIINMGLVYCKHNTKWNTMYNNNFLLQDVLRNEWFSDGILDCGAIYDVHINHKFIIDPVKVAASLAGTDLNCKNSFRLYL